MEGLLQLVKVAELQSFGRLFSLHVCALDSHFFKANDPTVRGLIKHRIVLLLPTLRPLTFPLQFQP